MSNEPIRRRERYTSKVKGEIFFPITRGTVSPVVSTRIGPWLFLVMINDLAISSNPLSGMWKFAHDTTVSEIVPKSSATKIQDTMDLVLQIEGHDQKIDH